MDSAAALLSSGGGTRSPFVARHSYDPVRRIDYAERAERTERIERTGWTERTGRIGTDPGSGTAAESTLGRPTTGGSR